MPDTRSAVEFADREILQKRRTPASGFQRILIVCDDDALIGRKGPLSRVGGLMGAASRPRDKVFLGTFEFSKPFGLLAFAIRALRRMRFRQQRLAR